MANPDLAFGALEKPKAGAYQLDRRDTQVKRRTKERKTMDQARKRDRGCRYPGCLCKRHKLRVDVAHQIHRGMGGDKCGTRTATPILISLCVVRHGEYDRGEIDIQPQDRALGFDGPADFYRRDERGQFQLVASEKRIGVSSTRDGR